MKKLILSFLIAASFIACGDKPLEPNVVTVNPGVKSWLKVQKSALVRDEHGLIHADVVFHNTSASNKQFYYTIHWFKDDGMAIPSVLSNRRLMDMAAYDQKAISIPAPNDKATNFSINIIPVK